MGIKACQPMSYSDLPGGLNLFLSKREPDFTACENGITYEEARHKLEQHVQELNCLFPPRIMWSAHGRVPIRPCSPAGEVQISNEKPNWLQRAGIALSDFFSALFD